MISLRMRTKPDANPTANNRKNMYTRGN
jgi:hypothetical protein